MISKIREMLRDPAEIKLFEPRCGDGARERAVGFLKRPCTFVVSDDLKVKTTASVTATTSSVEYPQEMQNVHNVRFNDLREQL
ncbi:hypothetical protein Fmac_010957 [Flemingia macrophylla]|uniref:Uncharacterized protein n=1 Tax=Flemingia macrophylla TaxID=520843 RepID=A0ABD1MLC3_9FABA